MQPSFPVIKKHLVKELSRSKFEQLTDALVKRSMAIQLLGSARCRFIGSDIDEVTFVGGLTKMPANEKILR
jgi:molecular chaperone DnaK